MPRALSAHRRVRKRCNALLFVQHANGVEGAAHAKRLERRQLKLVRDLDLELGQQLDQLNLQLCTGGGEGVGHDGQER